MPLPWHTSPFRQQIVAKFLQSELQFCLETADLTSEPDADGPETVLFGRMKTCHARRKCSLKSAPDASTAAEQAIRHDEVERARRLVADPGYPPPKVLQKLAQLLAQKLKSRRREFQNRQN
jgi:hypothetical protein